MRGAAVAVGVAVAVELPPPDRRRRGAAVAEGQLSPTSNVEDVDLGGVTWGVVVPSLCLLGLRSRVNAELVFYVEEMHRRVFKPIHQVPRVGYRRRDAFKWIVCM